MTEVTWQQAAAVCNATMVLKKKVQILLPNGLRNTVEFGTIFEYYFFLCVWFLSYIEMN